MRRAVAVLLVILQGCSLIATRPLSTGYIVEHGVKPDCSQSNWAAGTDVLFALFGGIGSIAAADEAASPTPVYDGGSGMTSGELAATAVGLGAFTVVTLYSAVKGFDRSSTCRSAVAEAGFPTRGDKDWLWPFIIFAAAAIASSKSGGGASQQGDPDSCGPYDRRTAVCRDGTYSCSLHRAGTCSHHGGVSLWL